MAIWPEVNGRPAARVQFGLSEKVGLPNFSNVDIGPICVERYVEDTAESRREAFREIMDEVNELIGIERENVLLFRRQQEEAAAK